MDRMIISLIITLLIISSIGYGGYLFIENKNLNRLIKIQEQDIRELSYQNEKLKYENNQNKDLINHYEITNRKLAKEIRNLKYDLRNKTNQQIKINPKHYTNHKIKINSKNYTNNKKYISKQKKKKTPSTNKRYHKYNGYQKLVSDSKIKQRSDGRFVSNSAIYGIYNNRIFSVNCGGNPRIHGVINECKAYAPYSTDILYFAKSNINELKNFNTRDHKIECHYNQKYGIMENCRAKIFRYIYK